MTFFRQSLSLSIADLLALAIYIFFLYDYSVSVYLKKNTEITFHQLFFFILFYLFWFFLFFLSNIHKFYLLLVFLQLFSFFLLLLNFFAYFLLCFSFIINLIIFFVLLSFWWLRIFNNISFILFFVLFSTSHYPLNIVNYLTKKSLTLPINSYSVLNSWLLLFHFGKKVLLYFISRFVITFFFVVLVLKVKWSFRILFYEFFVV